MNNDTYTTRSEAIQSIIIDALEVGELIATAEIDYDIELIADQILDTDERGRYFQAVEVEEFWEAVEGAASDEEEIIKLLLGDPTKALESGDRLPDGIVIDGDQGEVRAIGPSFYADREGREQIVPANWHNSEWGQQDGCGERVCAHTIKSATDAHDMVSMIRELAAEGKTADDYIAEEIQEHVNELVKQSPEYTEAKVLNAGELACRPHLCAEGDQFTVCVWYWYEGREITAEREITRAEYETYLADLTDDED